MQKVKELPVGEILEASKFEQMVANDYNSTVGTLTGYDCPLCLNRGDKMYFRDRKPIISFCRCMTIRENQKRTEKSGLKSLLDECTFDTYIAESPWQALCLRTARDYVQGYTGAWLVVVGAVGSGKTHICTAACGELIKQGKDVRYMLWRDDSVRLKSCVNEPADYHRLITPLKNADVLYIDDFFKTERGAKPTTADINLAFEILNYRYNDKNKATIISSERSIDELLDIDEAVGSRIYQRSKNYLLKITGNDKNWRLK